MSIKCKEVSEARSRYNTMMLSGGCITHKATFRRYRMLRNLALRSMGWTYLSGSVSL